MIVIQNPCYYSMNALQQRQISKKGDFLYSNF